MATTFIGITDSGNFLNQKFLDGMVFKNRPLKGQLMRAIMSNVKGVTLVADDLRAKIVDGDSYAAQYAGAGTAIDMAGGPFVNEIAYFYRTIGIPFDIDDETLADLDPARNEKDAVLLADMWELFMDYCDTLNEFWFYGDGSGTVAKVDTATAITSVGVVTLASTTPKWVFDRLLTYGRYVSIATESTGTSKTVDAATYELEGYIMESSYKDKTIKITPDKNTTSATVMTAMDGSTTGEVCTVADTSTQLVVLLASPRASASTLPSAGSSITLKSVMWGLGLNSGTDDKTNTSYFVPHGILRLNEYHANTSAKLYQVAGATRHSFQPMYTAGDAAKGLLPIDLQESINGMTWSRPEDIYILTDQIIKSDFDDRMRSQNKYIVSNNSTANIHGKFLTNDDKTVSLEVVPWWNGKGIVHGIDATTLRCLYRKPAEYKDAGISDPGWVFRMKDKLHANDTYYSSGNQLFAKFNYAITPQRNHNFVIDGLQTVSLQRSA